MRERRRELTTQVLDAFGGVASVLQTENSHTNNEFLRRAQRTRWAGCEERVALRWRARRRATVSSLSEIEQVKKLVQVGIRDLCDEEWEYISSSNYRVVTYFDHELKERQFEGQSWKQIADEIVTHLPHNVYLSFDIDGLDPKLCPSTGTPVPGGLEMEQTYYLLREINYKQKFTIFFILTFLKTFLEKYQLRIFFFQRNQ